MSGDRVPLDRQKRARRKLGQRVRVGSIKDRPWGTVIGIDNLGHPGVHVEFDTPINGETTCYATHGEVTSS